MTGEYLGRARPAADAFFGAGTVVRIELGQAGANFVDHAGAFEAVRRANGAFAAAGGTVRVALTASEFVGDDVRSVGQPVPGHGVLALVERCRVTGIDDRLRVGVVRAARCEKRRCDSRGADDACGAGHVSLNGGRGEKKRRPIEYLRIFVRARSCTVVCIELS